MPIDGAGYPDGLVGEQIPLVSRIVCACDAFSAMTTDRPYRQAMDRHGAIEELRLCAGTQFDPQVVEALILAADAPRPAQILSAALGPHIRASEARPVVLGVAA